ELSTTLLGVWPFPISHTAENIAGTARELLREWALEEKAMDATPGLDNIRSKTRRLITYFKSSTTAKEKLQQIQIDTGEPILKDPGSPQVASIFLITSTACLSVFLQFSQPLDGATLGSHRKQRTPRTPQTRNNPPF
ncbi:hypothetical protein D4764_0197070, partial [Takifugu flavidus]